MLILPLEIKKKASWDAQRAAGLMDSTVYASYAAEEGPVACVDGVAEVVVGDPNNTFRCSNVSNFFLLLSPPPPTFFPCRRGGQPGGGCIQAYINRHKQE